MASNLNFEMAKVRENRPNMQRSRLVIEMAHENPMYHEAAHDQIISLLHQRFPSMVFLGAVSDGEPFDK